MGANLVKAGSPELSNVYEYVSLNEFTSKYNKLPNDFKLSTPVCVNFEIVYGMNPTIMRYDLISDEGYKYKNLDLTDVYLSGLKYNKTLYRTRWGKSVPKDKFKLGLTKEQYLTFINSN